MHDAYGLFVCLVWLAIIMGMMVGSEVLYLVVDKLVVYIKTKMKSRKAAHIITDERRELT